MAKKRKFFKRQAGRHAAAPETQPDLQETELPESGGPDAPDAVEHPALQKAPPPRVSKAVYKIAAVLLAAIVVLLVIENWENLTPGNIGNWIRTKAVGLGFGDGYPAELVGSAADAGNFGVNGGNVYVVSDTALTVMNSSAKTLFTARHSYNNPAVSAASDRYLLYNMGGTGYQVETVSGTQVSGTSENGDITTGVIADSGKFALALQPADMASQLCVYNKDGSCFPIFSFLCSFFYIRDRSGLGCCAGFWSCILCRRTGFCGGFFGTLFVEIPLLAAVPADRIFVKDRITVFIGANLFIF